MTLLLKKNNAKTSLSNGVTAITTTITIADALEFPQTGDFLITIWDSANHPDPGDDSSMEILKVTGVSGNTLTVERAQEATTANEHATGDTVAMLITAGHFEEIQDSLTGQQVTNWQEPLSFTTGTASLNIDEDDFDVVGSSLTIKDTKIRSLFTGEGSIRYDSADGSIAIDATTSGQWNDGFDHSQLVDGNPHNVDEVDILPSQSGKSNQFLSTDGNNSFWSTVSGQEGDMEKSIYDPNTIESDVFDMDNMVEGADTKVLTAQERAFIASNRVHSTTTSGNPHELDHNDTENLQGGQTAEFFHMSESQHQNLHNKPNFWSTVSADNGLLSATTADDTLNLTKSSSILSKIDGLNVTFTANDDYFDGRYLRLDTSNDPLEAELDMNNNSIANLGYIDFDLDNGSSGIEGRLVWNSEDGTLDIGMPGGNVNLQIGQEMLIRAKNATGGDTTNGQIVYIDGATGSRPTYALGKADTELTSDKTIGMLTEDIGTNQNGYINTFGLVRDINLDPGTYTDGEILYLSAATAGEYTNVQPIAPEHSVVIGYVILAHATEGIAFINILNGPELNDIHDVLLDTPADNEFLAYDSGSSLWINQTPTEAGLDDRYYTQTLLNSDTDGSSGASLIGIAIDGGSPTISRLQDYLDNIGSTGFFSGGVITDGGSGTIDVTAGEGMIRKTDDDNAPLLTFQWPSVTGMAITNNTTQYVYVDYNGGSPQVVLDSSEFSENNTKIIIGVTTNETGAIESVFNLGVRLEESIGEAGRFLRHVHGVTRNERLGGLLLGHSGDANRDVTITSGELLWGRTTYPISAFDTSGVGVFDTYSASGKEATGVSQWPNEQYDNAGTLTTMTNNRWAVLWFYLEPDDHVVMIYGINQYVTEAQAEDESVPSVIPNRLSATGKLIGRFIFQKSDDTATVQSTFDTVFTGSGVTDHGNLAGLTDDDHTQYLLTDGSRALTGDWNVGAFDITAVDINATNLTDGTATLSGGTLSGLITPTAGTHATNKDYVDSLLQGLDWQESVLSQVNFVTSEPATPNTGDRYINTATGNSSLTTQAVTVNYIYEWNGSTWTESIPTEGFAAWVEDEDVLYVFNGTNWVKFGTTVTHGNLLGLSADDHTQYLLEDATRPLSANWDVGAFTITGTRFISDIATGTAPFGVSSTTVVTNLNSDTTDGFHLDQDVISGSTPTFTGTNITGVPAASILAGTFGTGAYIMDTSLAVPQIGASGDTDLLQLTTDKLTINGSTGMGVVPSGDFLLEIQDAANSAIAVTRAGTSASGPFIRYRKKRDGDVTVQDDDILGVFQFQGWDGNSYEHGAGFIARIDGAVSDGVMPTELVFQTTEISGLADRFTIAPDGDVTIAEDLTVNGGFIGLNRTAPAMIFGGGNTSISIADGNPFFEFISNTNSNNQAVGFFGWSNDANLDAVNLDADSKLGASVAARSVTTDGNAGQDAGMKIEFNVKPEAQTIAKVMTLESDGNITMVNDLRVDGGDIGITDDTDLLQLASGALTVNGTLGVGAITSTGVIISQVGAINSGVDNTTQGTFNAFGSATGAGGQIRIFVAGDEDDTIDFWEFDIGAGNDDLRIFPNTAAFIHTFRADGSIAFAGNLEVEGGNIGLSTDTDLLQLATDDLVINATTTINSGGGTSTKNNAFNVTGAVTNGETYMSINNSSANQFLKMGINGNRAEIGWDNNDTFAMGEFTGDSSNSLDVFLSIGATGDVLLAADLLVNGGNIGIIADPDLIQLASGALTVNGNINLEPSDSTISIGSNNANVTTITSGDSGFFMAMGTQGSITYNERGLTSARNLIFTHDHTTVLTLVGGAIQGDQAVGDIVVHQELFVVSTLNALSNLVVDSDIGISSDTDLLQLADNAFTINGLTKIVQTASGGTASVNADELVIDTNDLNGMTFLTANNKQSNIYFADPEDTDAGAIQYNHGGNSMTFRTNGGNRMVINSSGDTSITGNLQVNGGDIGITADTDLLHLDSGALTVNGSVIVNSNLLEIGNASATPVLRIKKNGAQAGTIAFWDGSDHWTITHNSSEGLDIASLRTNEDFKIFMNDGSSYRTMFFDGSARKLAIENVEVSITQDLKVLTGDVEIISTGAETLKVERNYTGGARGSTKNVAKFVADASAGDMSDGFGGVLLFYIEDDANVENLSAGMKWFRDGADTEGALAFTAGTNGNETILTLNSDTSAVFVNNLTVGGDITVSGNDILMDDNVKFRSTSGFALITGDAGTILQGSGTSIAVATTTDGPTLRPAVPGGTSLGLSSNKWSDLWLTSNANIGGDLNVDGGNINLLKVAGDAVLEIENQGDGNFSSINFLRERNSGTGVGGATMNIQSNTTSNDSTLNIMVNTGIGPDSNYDSQSNAAMKMTTLGASGEIDAIQFRKRDNSNRENSLGLYTEGTSEDTHNFNFRFDDSLGNQDIFGQLRVRHTNTTSGSEEAMLILSTMVAGTLTNTLQLNGGLTTLSGNLLVNGGDIGITADTDLIQIAENSVIVNGDLKTTGELQGSKQLLIASRSASFSAEADIVYLKAGEVLMTDDPTGFIMMKSGSITGLSIMYEIGLTEVGNNSSLHVERNGTSVFEINLGNSSDSEQTNWATQARGIDTFTAGQILGIYIEEEIGNGETNYSNVIVTLEIVYDT